MGSARWSDEAAQNITVKNRKKTTDQVFSRNIAKSIAPELSPVGLKFRESRDSDTHPQSYPVAVFFDVTGSMGKIPEYFVKESFPTLMETIIKHGTSSPHLMCSAIGDKNDNAPLQIGQFEAGAAEINTCLSSVWLEGRGGGDRQEAYLLAWLAAGRHMSIDSFEKRGVKGVLFTIGDEASHSSISADRLKTIMGYAQSDDITDREVLAEAERLFHVYHIHVEQGQYPSNSYPAIAEYWKDILPERVIFLDDYTTIAEVIGTTVALIQGADLANVVKDFDSKTAGNVTKALATINTSAVRVNQEDGVVAL